MPDIWELLIQLAERLGVVPLNKLAGCWDCRLDDAWTISVNGHRDERPSAEGVPVPPFHCLVTFNGWPAGLIGTDGGTIAAGDAANEETLTAALRGRLAQVEAADGR